MRRITILTALFFTGIISHAQFVMRLEIKDSDTITGLCDRKNVYTIMPMLTKNQTAAVCPLSDEEIEQKLNDVPFLKDHPKYKDKGILGIIVNCKGEVRRCEIDNKTKSPELDAQIEAVFKTLVGWKPAMEGNKPIDSSILFGFDIEKGKFKIH